MKKYFFVLILFSIVLFFGYVYLSSTSDEKQETNTQVSVNLPPEEKLEEEKVDTDTSPTPLVSGGYKTTWITVIDKNKLFLYSNLENKLASDNLATKNFCAHLVSGGFYNSENGHIGLFVSEGEKLSDISESTFYNGFFSVSKEAVASITDYPTFSPRISLQSGPILYRNGEKIEIDPQNDENARRIVIATTEDNLVIFLVLYDKGNTFSGPKLNEVGGIIESLNKDKNLLIVDALNIDGGAHSAFLSEIVKLKEASTIGSFFCIKP